MHMDFRERGREGEEEGEKHPPATSRKHPNQGLKMEPRHVL